jgi:hypothetical protein
MGNKDFEYEQNMMVVAGYATVAQTQSLRYK